LHTRVLVLVMVTLLLGVAGCGSNQQNAANVAMVNGQPVSQQRFNLQFNILRVNYEQQQAAALDENKDQEIINNLKTKAFEEVVLKELVRQEAGRLGLRVSPDQIDGSLSSFKEMQNGIETGGYQKVLDQLQMSEGDLRGEIEISLLYQTLEDKVTEGLTSSDQEAREYYTQHKELFTDPGGIRVYHILVDTQQQALEIMAQLKQGQDFAALAAQYSKDPGSKDQGGNVGVVNENTNFVPEFKQAALALQPGQLSAQPVKSQYGYHIIKAGERVAAGPKSFEQVKSQLLAQLSAQRKSTAFDGYLQSLHDQSNIEDLRK
jgi:parvulin-like peptidyl-prolyl isomerase